MDNEKKNTLMCIKEKAHSLGFELVGITPAFPAPDFDFFRWWLDRGYAGRMAYLQRGAEKRGNPEKILPGVKSILCLGMNYYTGHDSHPIARYAQGEDYHHVLKVRLEELERFIIEIDPTAKTKSYVDCGPILERSYASMAGLGWIGKNTMLINNGLGSYFFIGEILMTLEFDEYDRPQLDQCGTCSKCLDACPTGALVEPHVLDSNRCISYLTIEYRGDFTEEQSQMVGDHVYGCDICQEVCPYNDRIPTSFLKEFQPRTELSEVFSRELSEAEFLKLTKESAMDRIQYPQWVRNVEAARTRKR